MSPCDSRCVARDASFGQRKMLVTMEDREWVACQHPCPRLLSTNDTRTHVSMADAFIVVLIAHDLPSTHTRWLSRSATDFFGRFDTSYLSSTEAEFGRAEFVVLDATPGPLRSCSTWKNVWSTVTSWHLSFDNTATKGAVTSVNQSSFSLFGFISSHSGPDVTKRVPRSDRQRTRRAFHWCHQTWLVERWNDLKWRKVAVAGDQNCGQLCCPAPY